MLVGTVSQQQKENKWHLFNVTINFPIATQFDSYKLFTLKHSHTLYITFYILMLIWYG